MKLYNGMEKAVNYSLFSSHQQGNKGRVSAQTAFICFVQDALME
jgi:hypothetical protein